MNFSNGCLALSRNSFLTLQKFGEHMRLLILISVFVGFSFMHPIYSAYSITGDCFDTIWSRSSIAHTQYGLAIDNGRLFTSDAKGHYCFDMATGELKWFIKTEFDTSNAVFKNSDINPKVSKATVAFMDTKGLYGYDKITGKAKWIIKCSPSSDLSNPINDISVIAVGNEIRFINLDKGVTVKTIQLKEGVGEDRIVFRNERIAVFVNYYHMIVYDLDSQKTLFKEKLIELTFFTNEPRIDGNMLYYYTKSDSQTIINCYDLTKRSVIWSQNIDFQSNILISGNRLVTGKVCMDKNNGKILWNNKKIDFKSINCLCDDRIVAFLENGDYVIFRLVNGEIIFKDTRLFDINDNRSLSSLPAFYKGNI
jgi:outer membrane protein assembly factor BamB